MPCYSYENHPSFAADREREANRKLRDAMIKNKKLEAMLCGILTCLEGHRAPDIPESSDLDWYMKKVDFKEMGVSRDEFEAWWKSHKAEDKARRRLLSRQNSPEHKAFKSRVKKLSKRLKGMK